MNWVEADIRLFLDTDVMKQSGSWIAEAHCLQTADTSASFLLDSSSLWQQLPLLLAHLVSLVLSIWDTAMDRSVQELFLNFMIVLITVLLMWLLVKTYQD
ncbi:hypothetical protein PAMP_018660 [Pampus punctatissimus]